MKKLRAISLVIFKLISVSLCNYSIAQNPSILSFIQGDSLLCEVNSFTTKADNDSLNEYYEIVNCFDLINGSLLSTHIEINGKKEGYYFEYYSNGKIRKVMQVKNGLTIGKYIEWYSNGNIKVEGNYKITDNDAETIIICDTILTNHNFELTTTILCNRYSRKLGIWRFYNINGILTKEEVWEDE